MIITRSDQRSQCPQRLVLPPSEMKQTKFIQSAVYTSFEQFIGFTSRSEPSRNLTISLGIWATLHPQKISPTSVHSPSNLANWRTSKNDKTTFLGGGKNVFIGYLLHTSLHLYLPLAAYSSLICTHTVSVFVKRQRQTISTHYRVTTLQTLWNSLTFPWQCAALMPMLSGTHSMPVVLVLM